MDVQNPISISSPQFAEHETLRIRPLLLKPQWMNGLSERLLVSHYENNYGGALRRLNAIKARLATLDWARTLLLIGVEDIESTHLQETMHVLLKYSSDIRKAQGSLSDLTR